MSDFGFPAPAFSYAPPPPPPPPPPPIGYALPTGISYTDPYAGYTAAANSYGGTTAFNTDMQNLRYGAQNTFNTITAPLTQDPAKYAAIGASYGRATGGFGGAPAGGGGSVFDTGTSAVPYTSGPFMSAYSGGGSRIPSFGSVAGGLVGPSASGGAAATLPSQGSVTGGGSASGGYTPPPPPPPAPTPPSAGVPYTSGPFQSADVGGGIGAATPRVPYGGRDAITSALMNQSRGGGGGSYTFSDPTAPPPPQNFNDAWNATGMPTPPAPSPRLPSIITSGVPEPSFDLHPDVFGPGGPPTAPTDSFADRFGAAPAYDPNSFANRFGAGGYYQPGAPSQYYTGGQYGGPSRMPAGFTPPFSVDNPQGALPGAPFVPPAPAPTPAPAPSGDTLSPRDRGVPFQPPIMGMGDDDGYTPPFNDPTYFPNSMRNFQSPTTPYGTFQQPRTEEPIVGTASTYDPTAPGWRTGGMETASGATYNPSTFSAAVQTSLRNRFGGIPYGQPPSSGLVQAPGGQQAVVDVNDVGPLVPGRVMDLSTATMQYFNPSATPNSGLMPNMRMTPLPSYFPPGPVGPVGPTGPMLPTPGIPLPNMGPLPPYTPTTGSVRR